MSFLSGAKRHGLGDTGGATFAIASVITMYLKGDSAVIKLLKSLNKTFKFCLAAEFKAKSTA